MTTAANESRDLDHAPPPVPVAGGLAVPADFIDVQAAIVFDLTAHTAAVETSVRFRAGSETGFPLFDLRQRIATAVLDGAQVARDVVAPVDLGGGPRAHMRMLGVPLEAGSEHVLDLRYPLATPDVAEPIPVMWDPYGGRVSFDTWMSDLHPGRYLEQWLPANLLYDRFVLELSVVLENTAIEHLVVANGAVDQLGENQWYVSYADHCTSFSPLLLLFPTDRVEKRGTTVAAAGSRLDFGAVVDEIAGHLAHNSATFGAPAHGEGLLTYVWPSERGMEYDGACTTSPRAIEHEVFHAWFGRGVKPATAADGWIDEAITTWWTGRPPRERRWAQPFDAAAPPTTLRPAHPYARSTPTAAYGEGARFFAGLADILGVDGLIEAMAAFHRARAGGLVTTADLERHLCQAASRDLSPWFARFVHGQDAP